MLSLFERLQTFAKMFDVGTILGGKDNLVPVTYSILFEYR